MDDRALTLLLRLIHILAGVAWAGIKNTARPPTNPAATTRRIDKVAGFWAFHDDAVGARS